MKLLEKIKNLFLRFIGNDFFSELENIVCYICGNEALPMPLEPEEELVCLKEMEKGNSMAREKLIEHNLRLVVYIAKRFENTNIEIEDLISVGAIGLIKAISTYRIDKNIKLATYASRCIENEILMQIRKTTKIKSEVSFDIPLTSDGEGNDLLLSDILCTDADSASKDLDLSVEKQLLWDGIKKLGKREQEIMIMRFGLRGNKEKTQKEVAELMGISQSYISRIEKKILEKLKYDLESVS